MKNQGILAAALALAFSAVACSSSSTTTTATGSGGGSTASGTGGAGGAGPKVPAASCTMPGDKGNENGVGTFCTPGGGECTGFPKAGLCLADAFQDQWFCTRVGCKMDVDCGSAAHCHLDPNGAACVPDKCEEATTSSTSSTSSTGGGGGTSSSTGAGGAGGSK